METTNTIPAGTYSAADVLRLACELGVVGKLIRRARKSETRAYPVANDAGETVMWEINAPAAEHYTMFLVDNTGTTSAPPISGMFGAEISASIAATGALPEELADVCTLRRVVVDGAARWILDPA